MTPKLTPRQSTWLGVAVLAVVGIMAVGLLSVAARQNVFVSTVELSTVLPEAHDVVPGTSVRIRGVEAGQVVTVTPNEDDGVTITMKVRKDHAERLARGATARVFSTGMLGSKVIAIHPGVIAEGPLVGTVVKGEPTLELADAAAKLSTVADDAGALLKDARAGKGTLGKLLTDDSLYTEIHGLARDTRAAVDAQGGKMDKFVADGRDTLRSVKQGSDAVQRLPIVRGYVENATQLLVKPTYRREEVTYKSGTIFEPGTAILTHTGREQLDQVAAWILATTDARAEIVVAAKADPNTTLSADGAEQLTRKQAEVVVEYLKSRHSHKIGVWKRRSMASVGLGVYESPLREETFPAFLQVNVFIPQ
jgi:hypothetical protein